MLNVTYGGKYLALNLICLKIRQLGRSCDLSVLTRFIHRIIKSFPTDFVDSQTRDTHLEK